MRDPLTRARAGQPPLPNAPALRPRAGRRLAGGLPWAGLAVGLVLAACRAGSAGTEAPAADAAAATPAPGTGLGASPSPPADGPAAPAGCDRYGEPVAVGHLPPVIDEASGLAVTDGDPPVLWTHNDSGDLPRVYAIHPDGTLLATFRLSGIIAIDWEDISRGPCGAEDAQRGCLYVGDIGDNTRMRPFVSIYRFPIPDPAGGDAIIDGAESMKLRYPDVHHDAEALVVDPQGTLFILTKEHQRNFGLYSAPFQPGLLPVTLEHIGDLDLSALPGQGEERVTAADYDPGLRRLLVRTYNGALEYRFPPGLGLADLAQVAGAAVPVATEPQGESIAYGRGGFWHTSEGVGSAVYWVGCGE